MSLTVRQLEVIRSVARHGSVTFAASALGVSQPAISMTLRDAAKAAGFPFFLRRNGRLQPTAETKELLRELDRIFDGAERINRLISDMRGTQVGTIRIASTPTLANNLVPNAIVEFQKRRPRVQIVLHTMDNLSVISAVSEERVDIGLVLSPLVTPDVRTIPLVKAELICVVPTGHPLAALDTVTPEHLLDYPLISFSRSLPLGAQIDRLFKTANIAPPPPTVEVNQSSVACALVSAGAGIAILDPFWSMTEQHGLVALPIRSSASIGAEALLPHNASISRLTQLFVAVIKKLGRVYQNEVIFRRGMSTS